MLVTDKQECSNWNETNIRTLERKILWHI